jgi:hypothetical protein
VLEKDAPVGSSEPCLELPYAASKGAIHFRVPHASLDDATLQMLRIMVHQFGKKNIRIFTEQDSYLVIVRNGMVIHNHLETEALLRNYVIEGEIFSTDEGIILGDFIHRLTISLHYSEFQKLHKRAEGKVQELILKLVRKYLDKE